MQHAGRPGRSKPESVCGDPFVALYAHELSEVLSLPESHVRKVCLAHHDQDLSFCLNVSAYYSDKVIQARAKHFYFYHPSYCFRHSFQL
ncbi:unnamed protein product [Cylicocyclus nassatus]|uniref:Uncharacterized protein n=1 Tax=Cylicocyclus nassatus TaxID=53992 RepID=A0AA36GF90_CYLNA|nr:unnamed protein product [Cylicocyclus nassatus]